MNSHKCDLVNTPDIETYHSYSRRSSSVLDLAFASKNMHNHIKDWHIGEDADTGSDHEVILFSIVTEKVTLVDD